LHIAYNLSFKKGIVREQADKTAKLGTKRRIQEDFRAKMGLIVDVVKQGSGTTNDGNTARKFFEDPKLTAEITGLDENLIYSFSVILQVVASGEQINITRFRKYAKDTTSCYVDLYGWYNMSPTVHKLLIHGADIIENAVLPIGQLSEEAQEARNKDIKRLRECHSRKCSRMCSVYYRRCF
jgi:hypothetical protein